MTKIHTVNPVKNSNNDTITNKFCITRQDHIQKYWESGTMQDLAVSNIRIIDRNTGYLEQCRIWLSALSGSQTNI
jgi:hypothetical protein